MTDIITDPEILYGIFLEEIKTLQPEAIIQKAHAVINENDKNLLSNHGIKLNPLDIHGDLAKSYTGPIYEVAVKELAKKFSLMVKFSFFYEPESAEAESKVFTDARRIIEGKIELVDIVGEEADPRETEKTINDLRKLGVQNALKRAFAGNENLGVDKSAGRN